MNTYNNKINKKTATIRSRRSPKNPSHRRFLPEQRLNIKLLILDVDGVMTDGKLHYSDNGIETKSFHVHDGIGLMLLLKNNIQIAVISGRKSKATANRLRELGIKHVFLGCTDKTKALIKLKNKLKIKNENIAYVGDDLPDISIMQQVGLRFAVANATKEVLALADYITKKKGGNGAVREVCETILNLNKSPTK